MGGVNRLEEGEGWRDWLSKNLGRGCSDRAMEETKRLAPQSSVVAVQARTEWSACHEQLGARVVVTVSVHCVGEGMNVREVTPPRLIVVLKAKEEELERKRRRGGLQVR